jgi:hypothetical protein
MVPGALVNVGLEPATFYGNKRITGTLTVQGASISVGTNPAQSGALRTPNNQGLVSRNAANTADITVVNLNASNQVEIAPGGQASLVGGALSVSGLLTANAAGNNQVGGVTFNAGAVTTTGNITINKTRPEVILATSGINQAHLASYGTGSTHITANAYYDGTNWNIDQTTLPGVALILNRDASGVADALEIERATAGTNPRTMTALLTLSGAGQLKLPTVSSSGGILIGGDAQLYRDAANTLRTPGSLTVDTNLLAGTTRSLTAYNAGGVYVGQSPADPGANNLQVQGLVGIRAAPTSGSTLRLGAIDGVNEGGEIRADGAGAYPEWYIDNYQGHMRLMLAGTTQDFIFQTTGGIPRARFYASGGAYFGSSPADPGANNLTAQGTIRANSGGGANVAFLANSGGSQALVTAGTWSTRLAVSLGGTITGTDGGLQDMINVAPTFRPSLSTIQASGIHVDPVASPDSGITISRVAFFSTSFGIKTGLGSVTNAYGLYIPNPAIGTNNYAAYFGGNVGIGTDTPPAQLTVTGGAYIGSSPVDPGANNLQVQGDIFGPAGSTTMTSGFIFIPAAGGAPTGIPTARSGRVPLYYDTTNNRLYVYNGGWKSVALV